MQTAWCVFAKCTSKLLSEFISFAGTGCYNPALLADGVMDGWIWFVSHLSQHWLDMAFDLLHCGIVIKSSVSWHSLLQKDGMVTFSVCLVRHNPTFSIRYDGFWILNSEGWKPLPGTLWYWCPDEVREHYMRLEGALRILSGRVYFLLVLHARKSEQPMAAQQPLWRQELKVCFLTTARRTHPPVAAM